MFLKYCGIKKDMFWLLQQRCFQPHGSTLLLLAMNTTTLRTSEQQTMNPCQLSHYNRTLQYIRPNGSTNKTSTRAASVQRCAEVLVYVVTSTSVVATEPLLLSQQQSNMEAHVNLPFCMGHSIKVSRGTSTQPVYAYYSFNSRLSVSMSVTHEERTHLKYVSLPFTALT